MLWLIWTMVGSLSYARHYLQDYSAAPRGKMLAEFLGWLTCFYPWIIFAPLVFWLERRFPLGTRGWAKNLGWLVVAGVPLAYLGTVATQILGVILQILFQGPSNLTWQIQLPEVGV